MNSCWTKRPPNMSSNWTAGLFTNQKNNEQQQVPQNIGGQVQNSHGLFMNPIVHARQCFLSLFKVSE